MSNISINALNNQTMSSREIAKLTDKRHDHIIRDIREKIEPLIDSPTLGDDIKQGLIMVLDNRGYTKEYQLNKFVSEILVTGYDVERRAKVIKRFMELEQKLVDKENWKAIRNKSKEKHKLQADAINYKYNGNPKFYHFVHESDMLNKIVFGMTSKQLKEYFGIGKNDLVRDEMTTVQLEALEYLQNMNAAFISIDMDKDERFNKLTELYSRKYEGLVLSELHKQLA